MNYKKIKLNNGLRIILVPDKNSFTVTVLILVATGSKYESKENNGISHFLEHMCFKGTKKRPSQLLISSELESLGTKYNAFTSYEYTGYYVKSVKNNFDKVLEIISDIYLNPLFKTEEIDNERGPIIEEINMYEDLQNRKVEEIFMKLVYDDQPAGWPIAGLKENILKFNQKDFLDYWQKHYVAEGTVLIISGNFHFNNIENKILKHFFNISQQKKFSKIPVKENQKKPQYVVEYRKIDQTHLILGFRAFSIFDERKYALLLLSEILGGGMSSHFFQKIRTELGLAYYIYTTTDLYTDHGLFVVSAGVNNKKVKFAIEEILKVLSEILKKGVNEVELERAKKSYLGHLFLTLETSSELASFYGLQEVLGQKILTPNDLRKKIKNITLDEIKKIALDIFKNKNLNLALIGPLKDKNLDNILNL